MKIFKKIQLIRNLLNMNKKQFAESMSVAQPTIARYENGERVPDYIFIQKLISKFNVSPEWIFFDKEPVFLEADFNSITAQNQQLLEDINLILTPEELNNKLNLEVV